jgi:hypothetical protein
MKVSIYNVLFFLLVLLLVIHVAFYPFKIIRDLPLNGYYEKPVKPTFSFTNYFSKGFQDSTENYVKYTFGLFPGLTRIHHQVDYSFFGKLNVASIHRGKSGYLFRFGTGAFANRTFAPDAAQKYARQYAMFTDSLKRLGKSSIWIITPDKNDVFREFLPDSIPHPISLNWFYRDFGNALKEKQVDFIDFNEVTFREKNKFPFPVFNKGGIHWTHTYAARCFDSLCNHLSANGSISVHNKIDYKKSTMLWAPDFDIEQSANLLIPLEKEQLFHADVTCENGCRQKTVLLIGDSFCHAWMWNGWFYNCFSTESEFWYYNREAFKLDNTPLGLVDHKNVRNYLKKFDVIIIAFSAGNVESLDYGFMEDYLHGQK